MSYARLTSSVRLPPALTFSYASATRLVGSNCLMSLRNYWPAGEVPNEAWHGPIDLGVSGVDLWPLSRGANVVKMAWILFVESPGQKNSVSSSCACYGDGPPLFVWRGGRRACGWGSFCPWIGGLLQGARREGGRLIMFYEGGSNWWVLTCWLAS